jgi:Dyp-type peroxidase family
MIPLDQPLDLLSPEAPAFLADIQGNILKSHGRDHARHVFIRFGPDVAGVRAWLSTFATSYVTSAAAQNAQSAMWKSARGEGQLFASVLLSATGYAAAGIANGAVPTEPGGTYFQRGMKNQAQAERPFNDPPKEEWERPFQDDVHALVVLAHDDVPSLERHTAAIVRSLAATASATWVEPGRRLTFNFPRGTLTIEHFGFEDGISNPALVLQDAEAERAARGFDKWDPTAPLSLVLAAEPGTTGRYGSFFVFRKLEQNVRGFKGALGDVAKVLGPGGDEERAGAMAVGRFRDGTPIVPTTAPTPGAELNNFNFTADDPAGAVCPFHAHIRKTNPRGDSPIGIPGERRFRIARRGITYGERPDLAPGSTLPFPERGVGLLFMSYQSKLDQFAIQQEGSDSNDFARPGVGVDAVIGQNTTPVAQEWPTGSGKKFTMANFVKMLGGEYFFAPSMPFLRELGTTA